MWVQRTLSKETKWKNLALNLMKLKEVDLLRKLPPKVSNSATSLFYKQILKYCYEFYSIEPSTKYIGNECLWNNRLITINNKPVYCDYTDWREYGIDCISDLYHNGTLLAMNELSNKYQFTVRQLQYMSLIDAIPSTWKFSYKKYVGSCNTKLNEAKGNIIVREMVDDVNCLKSATVYQILI